MGGIVRRGIDLPPHLIAARVFGAHLLVEREDAHRLLQGAQLAQLSGKRIQRLNGYWRFACRR